jgi:hypothetical protein
LHHLDELVEVNGLGHIAINMEVVRAENVLFRLRRGDNHDWDAPEGGIGLDFRKNLPAIHLREVEIKKNDIRAKGVFIRGFISEIGQGADPVPQDIQVVPDLAVFESLTSETNVPRIVLDQEKFDRTANLFDERHGLDPF